MEYEEESYNNRRRYNEEVSFALVFWIDAKILPFF
jgi:hypothetical protein